MTPTATATAFSCSASLGADRLLYTDPLNIEGHQSCLVRLSATATTKAAALTACQSAIPGSKLPTVKGSVKTISGTTNIIGAIFALVNNAGLWGANVRVWAGAAQATGGSTTSDKWSVGTLVVTLRRSDSGSLGVHDAVPWLRELQAEMDLG
jgi:hypothetical protein